MTNAEIRSFRKNGYRPVEILIMLIQEHNYEFPDATAKISNALMLSDKAFEEMRSAYNE